MKTNTTRPRLNNKEEVLDILADQKSGSTSGILRLSSPFLELVRLMSSVKLNSLDAELNETTISDGKGGRIIL